jgi:hypothetical protein
MTPRDRERRYLAQLLTERDAAKEVRAYNLARFLRVRHDRLYDEHIAELRETARRSLKFSLLADLAGSAILAGAVLLLLWLTVHHHLSLASAAATGGAVVLLGQRLSFAGVSSGQISESAYYINDFLALLKLTPSATNREPALNRGFARPVTSPLKTSRSPTPARHCPRFAVCRYTSTRAKWSPWSARTARARRPSQSSSRASTSLTADVWCGTNATPPRSTAARVPRRS